MDLMEVPSHVVERFANSPAVLRSIMRHQISGRPMGLSHGCRAAEVTEPIRGHQSAPAGKGCLHSWIGTFKCKSHPSCFPLTTAAGRFRSRKCPVYLQAKSVLKAEMKESF